MSALALAQPVESPERAPQLFRYEAQVWNASVPDRAVVVLVPRVRRAEQRFPLLVALHGLGETHRGSPRGAWGWVQDYFLPRAEDRLHQPPLTRSDFENFVQPSRLDAINRALAATPYEGLVILLPYTLDVRRSLGGHEHRQFDHWLSVDIIQRAQRELPVMPGREHVGIDGISLGGLHSLWTGLGHPEVFGSVGAMQPAVRTRINAISARYRRSRTRPTQSIRVSTSTDDTLRPDVEQFHRALQNRHISHDFQIFVGPHDYPFNRGPGAIEMLLFHDRVLRGRSAI